MSAITSAFTSPLTCRFSACAIVPLCVDRWLTHLTPKSNLFWKGKTDEEKLFIQSLKDRSLEIWTAAAHLNPKFAHVPLDLEVLSGKSQINAFTSGYGQIRVSKDLVKAILAEEDLTAEQKLDMASSIVAHEMGHCLQRHICRNVCKHIITATMEALSGICPPLEWVIEQAIELCCSLYIWTRNQLLSDWFSRNHEQEADITGMLILHAFNTLCEEGLLNAHAVDLDMAPHLWTHFKPFENNPPFLLQLLQTHPSSEQRAELTAKMAWILKHNPDVLTNPKARSQFFSENRPLTSPSLLRAWHLPLAQLSAVMAIATPKKHPTPADQCEQIGFIHQHAIKV